MRYLPEGCLETDVTDRRFTVDHLNKAVALIGGKLCQRQDKQFTVEGGRIDNVGFTDRKSIWVFEHQDASGRADQVHTAKLLQYTTLLSQTYEIEGGILFCDSVSDAYKRLYQDYRELSSRRKRWRHHNLHFVKAQWNDQGEFCPELFDPVESEAIEYSTLDFYKSFVDIYAKEWSIQREERNMGAITLWHRIPELPSKYMAYVHTLKKTIKVGLHCLKDFDAEDESFLQKILPEGWAYRDTAKDRRTIEREFPLGIDQETLANETERLKRIVRKTVA